MTGKKMLPPVPVPGKTEWDRFSEFAKRIIAVPKPRRPKKTKRKRK